jgi:hypothetical protein
MIHGMKTQQGRTSHMLSVGLASRPAEENGGSLEREQYYVLFQDST